MGLYWRLLPDKTHALAGEVCTGGKKSKERVTVLVCANMSGSEKLPLLTIGKFKQPRCFRGVSCLPTEYEANSTAWMTSVVFEAWLRKWDTRLNRKGRKIALFVDNCTAHPHIQELQSIELIFLPPNTTSEIQPCDQGIIKTMKTYYRKNMVKRLIGAINSGSTIADFKITLLDGLQMLRKAWESVTQTTVANCFRKAGFVSTPEPPVEVEDPFLDLDGDDTLLEGEPLGVQISCSFDEYVSVDDGLQCAPLPSGEDIVSSIRQTSEEAEEGDDAGDPLPPVTYTQAYAAFLDLQSYLLRSLQGEDTRRLYHLLGSLETELLKAGNNVCVQTAITDYFK